MRLLAEIIEDAYVLFAPYTLGPTLSVCKECCVTDAEEQAILAAPLREVTSDVLWRGYFESARNYSDQEMWEMKHFLPRVLELVAAYDFPCFTPEVVFKRLDLDQPARWPAAERALMEEFALAFFAQCLHYYALPSGDELADMLILLGIAHLPLGPLLHYWQTTDTSTSLHHFVRMLLKNMNLPPVRLVKFSNPFSEPFVDAQLAAWLANPAVRAIWAARLEQVVLADGPADLQADASLAYEVVQHRLA